uniref:ABC transporter ATP-binding protein n=1 Tax=Agathobacter sp. TaxID=2021311 RepID=UPI004056AAFF
MKTDKKSTWQFLNTVTGNGKVTIGMLLVIQAFLGISSVFHALFLRDIINRAIAGEERQFFYAVVLFVFLVCVQLGLRALVRFLEEYSRSTLENRLKKRLFSTLMEKEYTNVCAVHSGEWMNRLTSDTVVVANGLTEILPNFVGMAVKLMGAVAMIIMLEPHFLYLIIPGGMILMVFSYAFRKVLKKLHKNVQEQDGILRMYMQESLSAMLVVRSYGVEQAVTESVAEQMKLHKSVRMKKNGFSNICNIGFGTVMRGAYVFGACFCGYGILKGSMSYGTFMAVLQLIGQIQSPFANISGFLPKFYSMMASCERLMEAEYYKSFDTKNEKSASEVITLYREQMKGIVLQDVSFSYYDMNACNNNADLQVLSNVNLTIQKGDCVAIMGSSGCGKSTFLKLLMGIYEPQKGSIHVIVGSHSANLKEKYDTSVNGVSLQEESSHNEFLQDKFPQNNISIRTCRRLFAYVPQGNCLMSGTIREVVAFHKKEITSDMTVEKALQLACANFVWELPNGVDTMLGEHGAGLSEGQMQRIAIARALYMEAPILILDEATSALDEMTEKKIIETLKQLTDKTILIATHRKAALAICNKQIVFQDGTIY